VVGWFGLLAAAATPHAIVEQLSGEIAKAMSTPAMRERALQEGATPVGSTPAQFDRFVRDEIAKWTPIIKQAGITLEWTTVRGSRTTRIILKELLRHGPADRRIAQFVATTQWDEVPAACGGRRFAPRYARRDPGRRRAPRCCG
jgi:hypothetical protein